VNLFASCIFYSYNISYCAGRNNGENNTTIIIIIIKLDYAYIYYYALKSGRFIQPVLLECSGSG